MIKTDLENKVVIVTGASAGIGRATAKRFLEEGCRVAAWDVQDPNPDDGFEFQKVDDLCFRW